MVTLMLVFGATVVAFALVVVLMAVGVMLGRREIQGSCGGLGAGQGAPGESHCSLCSNPDAACSELARRTVDAQGGKGSVVTAEDCDRQCQTNACSQEKIQECNRV